MPNYKKMYFILFNEISEAINRLQEAQRKTEELYIDSTDVPLNADIGMNSPSSSAESGGSPK